MKKILPCLVVLGMLFSIASCEAADAPWWKREKIRVMWGQWAHVREDQSKPFDKAELPRDLFRDVALAGGTVFVEHGRNRAYLGLVHARHAHEFGMKYFATQYVHLMTHMSGGRRWVEESGQDHWFKCPLDEEMYAKWLVEPHLEGARAGLVDGIHVDWEHYGGHGEATGSCYCDDCFSKFPAFKKSGEELPEKIERFAWITQRDLVAAYEENFHKRRVEMFTRLREKLHAAKPDLLFSSYGTLFSDFTRAMNTAETPFIFLDHRHYSNDDRRPWWESYGSRLRKEGYLYIPGGWTNGLFGAQASQVSAAQWIYEASINEDGCWLWFERELDDEILRAYAAADRQIQAVLSKLGDFLFHGQRDPNFVTAIEWTGRPELQRTIRAQTYHLGDEHLVHLNNVDTDWPIRVRVRFPRIEDGDRWTVRDGMHELYFAHNSTSPIWTRDDLKAGVVVALEPRSDLFVRVAPEDGRGLDDPTRLIHSREFSVLPDHEAASKTAGPIKTLVHLYRMKNAVFGKPLEALIDSTKNVYDLPNNARDAEWNDVAYWKGRDEDLSGWYFKADKQEIGAGEGWFQPGESLDDWIDIDIGAFWGEKGGIGAGWYRRDIDVPVLPEGQRVYLHFGAVDEHLVLWIDGTYAGDYDREPDDGWNKPFALDVTGKLTTGRHHLAMRVNNSGGAGGVWKPVSVRVGAAIGETAEVDRTETRNGGISGRLVYTATEPMGFHGLEGPLTIGNAIRTADANGANHLRVRQLRGHLWSPVYSPDGKRIAFVHDAGGRGQIFVMNADGSGAVNISSNDACDRSPRWSPDGKRLAFMSDRTGDWDIYIMNADGSDQRRVAGNPGLDRAPAWSPDGTQIAWESHVSGMPAVWICGADGQDSRPLIAPDRPLTILPTETIDPHDLEMIASSSPDNSFYMMEPVWSPDGRRIAAAALTTYSATSVVVLDADGSAMLPVIDRLPCARDLVWSPDGAHLAGSWRTAPGESERSGIFVVKADGTDENQYGKWLVDVTPTGPRLGGARRWGLMSWYSHGSAQPRRVVKTFTSIEWSPDSKTLAFSCDMHETGAFYVYTIPAEGGDPARIELTRSAWPNEIMWLPR